jgi:GDP-L-fucose synthase
MENIDMEKTDKICIIGDKGMLGHAIWIQLLNAGYSRITGCDLPEVDLCDQFSAQLFFEREKPSYVFFLAAVSAGISYKKSHPADVMLKNLQMIINVIECAHRYGCIKMINVCSALIYPASAQIPYCEDDATHIDYGLVDTPYSLAKAVGMQLGRYYHNQYGMDIVTCVPCNFFGAYAPFEGERAGVVPSLIARFHRAKTEKHSTVEIWGTGNACRELLGVLDVGSACLFLMEHPTCYDLINIGCGYEFSIRNIAELIQKVVGYEGELFFDGTKPEGRLHMQLNIDRIKSMGWAPSMNLETSIEETYKWYLSNLNA